MYKRMVLGSELMKSRWVQHFVVWLMKMVVKVMAAGKVKRKERKEEKKSWGIGGYVGQQAAGVELPHLLASSVVFSRPRVLVSREVE